MIDLLIADDEIFTREGLIEMLPLKELGITETRQAFDGVNALEIIKTFKPDIILTDVRMPRMTGIELAFEARKLYPDCAVIFMSGYSDKEYLKSAIKLKAISYVEKPIEMNELISALQNALLETSKSRTYTENMKDIIALEMIEDDNSANVESLISSCMSVEKENIIHNSSFLTMLISVEDRTINDEIMNDLKSACEIYNLNYFISQKSDSLIVLHLLWEKKSSLTKENNPILNSLLASFECLKNRCSYFISVGKTVHSLEDIPKSFSSANENLKYKFFFNYNSVISLPNINLTEYEEKVSLYKELSEYLDDEDEQKAALLINKAILDISKHNGTSITYIKDMFYRISKIIIKYAQTKNISISKEKCNNTLHSILSSTNIYVLENAVIDLLKDVFSDLRNNPKVNSSISAILDYIHKNYSDSNLCLEDISKNTYLTSTYICVIFKDNMSKTVNKYITEYRIEKAKHFLKDSNIKMSSVAKKVGYNDPNYFSKIFRKETSYTPSEYRRYYNSEA